MPTNAGLTTTVKNISGGTLNFSFLPPHGKTLTNGQDYTVYGDIWDYFRKPNGVINTRKWNAFYNSLRDTKLAIVSSPTDVFYDAGIDESKVLQVASGVVSSTNPSWGGYSGSP